MNLTWNIFEKRSLLLVVMLSLGACGKNLHLTEKAVSKDGVADSIQQISKEESIVANALSSGAPTKSADGQILPLSVHDEKELSLSFSTETSSKESVYRTMGDPSFTFSENGQEYGYLRNAPLVFRAIHQVAPREMIEDLVRLELRLKGVRLMSKQSRAFMNLSEQKLCMLETGLCSSPIPDVKLKAHLSFKDGSTLYQSEGEVVINLKEIFGLNKMSPSEVASWIYANSVEFANPGYRKFRISIGNHIYFDSGELVLQVSTGKQVLPADLVEAPSESIHGSSDLEEAKPKGKVKRQTSNAMLPAKYSIQ
jgi:hypothetical protein